MSTNPTKPITVVATFQARPGKKDELKKALLSLIHPTRKEAGCLNYDLHQLPEEPEKFLFYENWTSRQHLDAHLENTHIMMLLPRIDELCVGMAEIKIWDRIG
jgi:quinol monooxygenase YgiN